jgi:ABC-type transport system involved in cytochrome bd biosynthesis fused ATPase/permease subunit
MKVYNGNQRQERRKKRILTPIIYLLLEIILIWLILSIINISFDITSWSTLSHIVVLISFIYFSYKTYKIYQRQKTLTPRVGEALLL